MARPSTKKKDDKPEPPSAGMAFIIGLLLFSIILCPAGVFMAFNLEFYNRFDMLIFPALGLGCLGGLVIAIIPAFIFMRVAMKKIKY